MSHISSYYLIFRNYPTGPSGCAGVGCGGRGEKLAVRDLQRGGRRGAGHGQGVQAGQGRHRGHGPPQGLQVGRCPGKVMVVTTRAVLLQDERGHGGGAGRLGVLPGPRHQEAEAGPAPAAEEGEAPQHQGLADTLSPVESQEHRVES